jgi:3-methyladenine DNA glycosylase AlkD
MDIDHEATELHQALAEAGTPERAEGSKAYLKSPLKFHGVNVPTTRRIARRWARENAEASLAEVYELAEQLWAAGWHEDRFLAVMLLNERAAELSTEQLPLIERMLDEAHTWANLDGIAVWVVGAMIDNDPDMLAVLPRWAESSNFWVRRATILAQLTQFRRGEGDLDLFEHLAVPMFYEGEAWTKDERFFIRKAIGWTLREIGKVRPEWVVAFVGQHRAAMSGLTFREGTRNLPDEYTQQLNTN